MAKYVIVECNRINSQSNYGNLNENEDIYKNTWTNNISTTGLEIEPGDEISVESVAVNNVGASDNGMEFIGQTSQGYLDNKVNVEYGFYVNHTGRNTGMLPLTNYKVVDGNNIVLEKDYVKQNWLRTLGSPFIDQTQNDPASTYLFPNNSPRKNFLFRPVLVLAGTGYIPGAILDTGWTVTAGDQQGGVGFAIKVLTVTDISSAELGVIDTFEVTEWGQNYQSGNILEYTPGGATQPNVQINLDGYINSRDTAFPATPLFPPLDTNYYATKNYNGEPDGLRYYLGNIDYTGNAVTYPSIPETDYYDTSNLTPDFKIRSKTIDFEVPVGFSTPDNIGGILTDTLHRPTRYNETFASSQEWDYINPDQVQILIAPKGGEEQGQNIQKIPNIIQTPTWQPIACNNFSQVLPTNTTASYTGALHSFYGFVAWEKPERLEWLNKLNQLYFGDDPTDTKNQLFTGRASTLQTNVGDFGNQILGEFGLTPRLLNSFAFSTLPSAFQPTLPYTWANEAQTVEYSIGGLIVTNMYYTKENVELIAKIFKKTEKYYGNRNNNVDVASEDYHDNQAVILDIGKYRDEDSSAFPLSNYLGTQFDNQRLKYACSQLERSIGVANASATVGNNHILIDQIPDFNTSPPTSTQQSCEDTQDGGNNYIGNGLNDGAQMPQMVVTSRWRDDYAWQAKPNSKVDYNATYNSCAGDFNLPDDGDGNQSFSGGYNGEGGGTYTEMIGWARDNDVAVFPIYPATDAGNSGTADFVTFPDDNNIGRPFLAFRSHFTMSDIFEFDRVKNVGDWKAQAWNSIPGQYIGYDASFIRNKAVQLYNLQNPSKKTFDEDIAYNPVMYVGAVNPLISFSSLLSRFEISGLNSPMTIGNGFTSAIPTGVEANTNPESLVFNSGVNGSIMPCIKSGFNAVTGGVPTTNYDWAYIQPPDVRQRSNTMIGSQAGIAIIGISLYKTSNNELQPLSNTDYHDFTNTLFDKMGFDLNQILPLTGDAQANFVSKLPIKTTQTYQDSFENIVNPVTTGAYISSGEFQPLSINENGFPMFDLGGDIITPVEPDVTQASLVGQRLPQKLDFPYLCVYSSIVAGGTDTVYIGSGNGHQLIPCVAIVTRNYTGGDFFYGLEQSFSYTATKNFTLTDVTTDVRLPNGSRPQLQPHSCVIYKIVKAQTGLPATPPPPIKNKISRIDKGNDEDRRRRIQKAV